MVTQRLASGLIRSEEIERIVAFHNRYHLAKRKKQDWMWQYGEYKPEKVVFGIAMDNAEIIGTQAIMPFPMRIGRSVVLTGKSENTLLAPEYRGKGIMEELYRTVIERCMDSGIECLWGFTAATKAFRKYGFCVLPGLTVSEKPGLNPFAIIMGGFGGGASFSSSITNAAKSIGRYLQMIECLGTPTQDCSHKFEFSNRAPKQRSIESLLERMTREHPESITLPYDKMFRDWRITGHPFFSYKYYSAYEKGDLRAMASVVLHKGTVAISDLTGDSAEAMGSILLNVLLDFRLQAGRFVSVFNPHCFSAHTLINQLRKLRFNFRQQESLVLMDLSSGKYGKLDDVTRWHISGLWSEGYAL